MRSPTRWTRASSRGRAASSPRRRTTRRFRPWTRTTCSTGRATRQSPQSGRPRPNWSEQSDGPALRTLAILRMYTELDVAAQAVARDVIATDIGYLRSVYQQPTTSLWEERDGYSFFARAVQLRCFSELAANAVGGPVAPGVAEAISWLQARLVEHWNSTERIYVTFGGPAGATNPPLTPGYDPNVDIVMACV